MIAAKQLHGVAPFDTTTAGTQAARYWLPPVNSGPSTLILWSHQHTGTEAIAPGAFSYPFVHAAIQEGWMFAATRQHGDSWGNADALADLANLYSLVNGLRPVSKVILVGASMGGLATANAVAAATVPNVAGAISIDAAFDLAQMYSNAVYTASIKTAYGIASDGSDYATKTAGFDPMLKPGSAYGSLPWRFYASNSDTSVPRASHGDAMRTKVLPLATEAVMNTHVNGHLSGAGVWPHDLVPFIKRCIA